MPIVNYDIVVPYRYVPDATGALHRRPCVVVTVVGPSGPFELVAHVDSGSRYVVFDGQIAEAIGINLLMGTYIGLQAAAGLVVPARLHDVRLELEGYGFPCRAAFTEQHITRALLGREGFFDLWQTGFRERLLELYLSPEPFAYDLIPAIVPGG